METSACTGLQHQGTDAEAESWRLRVVELEGLVKSLTTEKEAKSRASHLEHELGTYLSDLEAVQSQYRELQGENTELLAAQKRFEEQEELLAAELGAANNETERLTEELDNAKRDFWSSRKDGRALKKELLSLEKTYASLLNESANLQSEVKTTRALLDVQQKKEEGLLQQIKGAQTQYENLCSTMDSGDNEELAKQLVVALKECEQLKLEAARFAADLELTRQNFREESLIMAEKFTTLEKQTKEEVAARQCAENEISKLQKLLEETCREKTDKETTCHANGGRFYDSSLALGLGDLQKAIIRRVKCEGIIRMAEYEKQKMHGQLEGLKAENGQLKEKVALAEAKISEKDRKMASMGCAILTVEEKNTEMEKDFAVAESQLRRIHTENERLKIIQSATQQELGMTLMDVDELLKSKVDAGAKISQLETDQMKLAQNCAELTETVTQLRSELGSAAQVNESLTKETQRHVEMFSKLTEKLEAGCGGIPPKSDLHNRVLSMRNNEDTVVGAEELPVSRESEVDKHSAGGIGILSMVDELMKENTDFKNVLGDLHNQNKDLEMGILRLREEKEALDRTEEIDALNKEIAALTTDIRNLNSRNSQYCQQLHTFEAEVVKKDAELMAIQKASESFKADWETCRMHNCFLKGQLEETRFTVTELETQLQEHEPALAALKDAKEKVEANLTGAQAQITLSAQAAEKEKDDRFAAEQALRRATAKLSQVEANRDSLQADRDNFLTDRNQLRTELMALETKFHAASRNVAELQGIVDELTQENETLKDRIDDLELEKEGLQYQLENASHDGTLQDNEVRTREVNPALMAMIQQGGQGSVGSPSLSGDDEDSMAKLAAESKDNKQKLSEALKLVQQQKEEVELLQKEKAEMQKGLAGGTSKSSETERELQEKLVVSKEQKAALRTALAEMRTESMGREQKMSNELVVSQEQIEALRSAFADLTTKSRKKEEDMSSALEAARRGKVAAENSLADMTAHARMLEQNAKVLMDALSGLREDKSLIQQELEATRDECCMLERKVEELTLELNDILSDDEDHVQNVRPRGLGRQDMRQMMPHGDTAVSLDAFRPDEDGEDDGYVEDDYDSGEDVADEEASSGGPEDDEDDEGDEDDEEDEDGIADRARAVAGGMGVGAVFTIVAGLGGRLLSR